MPNKRNVKKSVKEALVLRPEKPFHERFEIKIGIDEARRGFINRIKNRVFGDFFSQDTFSYGKYAPILRRVADDLREEYEESKTFSQYMEREVPFSLTKTDKYDFQKCLSVLESINKSLPANDRARFNEVVNLTLKDSEIDLGIGWENGIFFRTGARILDQELVNESLRWLSDPRYKNVCVPFEKGLAHLLQSEKKPELLSYVITDMYESLEALSKIATGRPTKDLSANAELFIQKLKISEAYKRILKEYILYANDFRHALDQGKARPKLSVNEIESFVYLTALFIRVAKNSLKVGELIDT